MDSLRLATPPTVPPRRGRPVGSGLWVGEKLERLRRAYEADQITTAAVGHEFGISTFHIRKLARKYGWKRRMSVTGIAALTAARRGRMS